MTINEAANKLGVSHSTIRREIRDSRLAARRVRARILVDDDDFARYLRACQVPSSAPPASDQCEDDDWRAG